MLVVVSVDPFAMLELKFAILNKAFKVTLHIFGPARSTWIQRYVLNLYFRRGILLLVLYELHSEQMENCTLQLKRTDVQYYVYYNPNFISRCNF